MKTKQLALEALKRFTPAGQLFNEAMADGLNVHGALSGLIAAEELRDAAIAALEADIAKPVEPVAWLVNCLDIGLFELATPHEKTENPKRWTAAFPVYTAPQDPAAAALPAGWKLVPVEPTREMWKAAGDAVVALQKTSTLHHDKISDAVYRAMLAAAPSTTTKF
jgi:hypothetical protein